MVYLAAGALALIAILAFAHWAARANPRTLASVVRWTALGALGAGSAFLLLTGRMALALMLATGLIPFLRRWGLLKGGGFGGAGKANGQTSEVATDWISMTLDHDGGRIDGEVLRGSFKGKRLGELPLEDLTVLLDECRREDPQGARLVETFLDKAHPDWRATAEAHAKAAGAASAASGRMSRDEALSLLGLAEGASVEEIRAAHRRLMQQVHPDKGGSDYLAAKINAAKDVLLG
ncbi:MAG: molecular chaperone DnaJ [Alphaproteobacteria bacterium]|nr:molecular chaperone DnaJ [Alphaproteobacteria bacterium]